MYNDLYTKRLSGHKINEKLEKIARDIYAHLYGSKTDRIHAIYLQDGGAVDFPPQLRDLNTLKKLVMKRTYSRIGSGYSNLPPSLTSIDISNFSSECDAYPIPSREAIEHLRLLEELSVVDCLDILRVPQWLPSSLTALNLSHNHMSDLQSGMWLGLPNLDNLDLSHNDITHLPVEMKHLSRLLLLTLSHNSLVSLPPIECLSGWTKLAMLYLDNNKIGRIDDTSLNSLSYLTSLEVLSLENNFIGDSFVYQKEALHLPSLLDLDLSNNVLAALPVVSPATKHVKKVTINDNLLTSVPTHFVKPFIHTLEKMEFNNNFLLSSISLEFGRAGVANRRLWTDKFSSAMSYQLKTIVKPLSFNFPYPHGNGCREFLNHLLLSKQKVIWRLIGLKRFVYLLESSDLDSSIPVDHGALFSMIGFFMVKMEVEEFTLQLKISDESVVTSYFLA